MRRVIILAAALLALGGPAAAQSINAPTTNTTVVITTGNSFQTILAAQSGTTPRRSLTIQNNNIDGSNCWIYVGGGSPTKATSILLSPGGSYQRYAPYVPSDAIQATCAANNDTMYLDTQ